MLLLLWIYQFQVNQQYLFEILSVSLGIDNRIYIGDFDYKGIVDDVTLDDQSLLDDQNNLWEHQKGLTGEYDQIYTQQGSSKVSWDPSWTKNINRAVTWFQTTSDLDHLAHEDTNANPILLDANGLSRGRGYVNGNDLGLYWTIQGVCYPKSSLCQQVQVSCLQPMQRYYHIPSDWLMPKNNLLTIFDEMGATSPGSVRLVQRVVTI